MLTYEQKIKIVRDRIDGKSMGDIAEEMHVSRQAISDFIKSLSEKRLSAKKCPFVALRRWFNNNNLTIEELASKIKVPTEELENALYIPEDCAADMDLKLAERLAEVSGIPVEKVKKNERSHKKKRIKVTPKDSQYKKVLYPEIANFLSINKMSISAFADFCEMDYSAVYFAITTIPSAPVSTSIKRVKIAHALGLPVEEAFSTQRKKGGPYKCKTENL